MLTETVYETGDDKDALPGPSESSSQHLTDEPGRQLTDITRDEKGAFQKYLSQYNHLPICLRKKISRILRVFLILRQPQTWCTT